MFSCGAVGAISLVTLVPEWTVSGAENASEHPVMVHMTVCRNHLVKARTWLRRAVELGGQGDEIDTYSTALLMEHWGQVEADMDGTPILRVHRTA
jgi:hypothetical protein